MGRVRLLALLLALLVIGVWLTWDPVQPDVASPPPGSERCFAAFRGGELEQLGYELNIWEYPNEDGKGRVVCSVDPGSAEGRILDETPSSLLIDTGGCTGWVSRVQATQTRCE